MVLLRNGKIDTYHFGWLVDANIDCSLSWLVTTYGLIQGT